MNRPGVRPDRKPRLQDRGVREDRCERTGRALSPARLEGRRIASEILRASSAVCPLAAGARALGVHPSRVEDLADPDHPAAITLGDVLALPRRAAQHVLVSALTHVREDAPAAELGIERRTLRLGGLSGELAAQVDQALADGAIDQREHDALLAVVRRIHAEADATLVELRPARR